MPRSASRDLADRYEGNRGYFRRPDAIRRAKAWLALVALGLSGGWALLDATDPPRAAYSHSHGPLADPHAAWDTNCAACHKPHAFDLASPFSVFRARERWHDLTCEKCHAGPAHHASVTQKGADFHAKCANCHHDHGGRTNSLVRITDSHCTVCHANLSANHASQLSEFESSIPGFDKHPEFGVLRAFPPPSPARRGVKFSHSLHMTPGLAYSKGGGETLTAGAVRNRFGDAAAARYAAPGRGDDSPIQLNCASCHQLDAGRPPPSAAVDDAAVVKFDFLKASLREQPLRAVLPPRAAGAYYLPVNFDLHCKTCHPIAAPGGSSEARSLASFALPHRVQPAELRKSLAAEYARQLTFSEGRGLSALVGPGGRLDGRTVEQMAKYRGEIDRLTTSAMGLLVQGLKGRDEQPTADRFPTGGFACGKCHLADTTAMGEFPNVAPAETKSVWLRHAKFDHAAHRGVGCAQCHPGTESRVTEDGRTEVIEFEPVRIRGVKSCQQCHSPAGTRIDTGEGLVVGGGVRHNCTDCHRYHNGDHALAGRGAPQRDPLKPLSVTEFLRGK